MVMMKDDGTKKLLKGTFPCKTVIMRNFMSRMGNNLRTEGKVSKAALRVWN